MAKLHVIVCADNETSKHVVLRLAENKHLCVQNAKGTGRKPRFEMWLLINISAWPPGPLPVISLFPGHRRVSLNRKNISGKMCWNSCKFGVNEMWSMFPSLRVLWPEVQGLRISIMPKSMPDILPSLSPRLSPWITRGWVWGPHSCPLCIQLPAQHVALCWLQQWLLLGALNGSHAQCTLCYWAWNVHWGALWCHQGSGEADRKG